MVLILSTVCLTMTPKVVRSEPGIQTIKKGQIAPNDGVFYTKESHAKLVAKIKLMESTCNEKINHSIKLATLKAISETNRWKLEADSWKRQLKISEGFTVKQRNLLLKQVATSQQTPWYREPWFVSSVTVVLTVGLAEFSVWSFKQLAEQR